ncbi:DUF3987 domain-containing protein [Planctellipticum variicoloris]|uniref:DUF3987 domain-containing protein n=1 Tax=Planctellipticum variicoloris TaxID=3064265 RepID=UPI003013B8A7|nr:DUF3987 domain-containing protein [Planctomycetaceae bacterium SH412]
MSGALKHDRRDVAEQAVREAGWKLLSAVSYDPQHIDRLRLTAELFVDPVQVTIFLALAAYHRRNPDRRMVSDSEIARFMATSEGLSHLIHDDAKTGDVNTVTPSDLRRAFDNAYYVNDLAKSHAQVLQDALFERTATAGLAAAAQGVSDRQTLVANLRRVVDDLSQMAGTELQVSPTDPWELPIDGDDPWPKPLSPEALYGPAGEFVRIVGPETESDAAALLFHFLAYAGALFGRNRYFLVEAAQHYSNLFMCFVGQSSKGRKGSAHRNVERFFGLVDGAMGTFIISNVTSGLSSGEGLIYQVRDDVVSKGEIKEEGVADKRLIVVESEFANTLKVVRRETNTLSAIVRDAWDKGNLRTLTKQNPTRATGSHIVIVGHITRDELRRLLTETDQANGFTNRFLWICSGRSKLLPNGGHVPEERLTELVETVRAAVEFAHFYPGQVHRTEAAAALWEQAYPILAADRPGMLGSVTNRAEAQVLRLSLLFSILDCSGEIDVPHLRAALACWRYCEQSAQYAFGRGLGDKLADEILALLRVAGKAGKSRSELSAAYAHNKSGREICRALDVLQQSGLAYCRKSPSATGRGRPAEIWYAGRPDERNEENERSPECEGIPSFVSFNSYVEGGEAHAAGYVPQKPVGRILEDTEVDGINAAFDERSIESP